MSTRGLTKLLAANSTRAAWHDWHILQSWCVQTDRGELAARHTPKQGAGYRTVDESLGNLRVDLGVSRCWENSVLDGLNAAHESQHER